MSAKGTLLSFGAAAIVLAGFRSPSITVGELRPKLTILHGMEPRMACGTGTTATRIANSASYTLDMPCDKAIASARKELIQMGFKPYAYKGKLNTFLKKDGTSAVVVVFKDYPGEGKSNCYISVGIQTLTWYGLPVPSI